MMKKIVTVLALTIMIISLSHSPNFSPQPVVPVGASFIQTEVMTTYDGSNSFSNVWGITANSTTFAVSDNSLDKIFFFNDQTQLIGTLDGTVSGPANFSNAIKIFIDNQYIMIPDINLHQVKVLDSGGNYLFSLGNGTTGLSNEELNSPEAVVANGTHIFVSDRDNGRVQVFTIAGNYAATYGSGTIGTPRGLAHNGTHLFVADIDYHVIRIFHPNGTLSTEYVGLFGPRQTTSSGIGRLNFPIDVAIDPVHGYVYILTNTRVYVYIQDGAQYNYIGEVANLDESNSVPYETPTSVTSNGTHVFVSEALQNNRIQIFKVAMGTTTVTETSSITETTTETQVTTETVTETETETNTETQNVTQITTETEIQHQTVVNVTTETVIQERNNTITETFTQPELENLPLSTGSILIGLMILPILKKKFTQ